MVYYLDGYYPDIINKEPAHSLYSSAYSQADLTDIQVIKLEAVPLKETNYAALSQMVDFYNRHTSPFETFERQMGINLWFLENFRLYFAYENFLLRCLTISTFLKSFPEGRVITPDERIGDFLPNTNIEVRPETAKAATPAKKLIVREVLHVLKSLGKRTKIKSDHLILANTRDDQKGTDKWFHALEGRFDKMINRELWIQTHPLTKASPKNRRLPNTDALLCRYALSFSWLRDVPRFLKAYKKLTLEVSKLSLNASPQDQKILQLFFKRKSSFLIYYIRFRSFDRFFSRQSLKGVLFSTENSPQQKVIQYAAVKHQVKTYGFQHGTISDLAPAYIYEQYKKKPVLPTVTMLWGTYFEQLLVTKGGYLPSQVAVVGNLLRKPKKANLTINLNPDRAIMLYASQPQPDEALRKQELKDVLQAAKILQDQYQLIIRPHPREREDDYFIDTGQSIDFSDFIIDRRSDLLAHLEACDLLITSYSTVGAEFIPFFKPLVILDYLELDKGGYLQEGVGLGVKNGSELTDLLRSGLPEIDKDSYENFIRRFWGACDDLAHERVLTILDKH